MPYSLVFNYICISSPEEAKFLYIYLLRAISWLVAQTSSTYLHVPITMHVWTYTWTHFSKVNLWLNLDARNYISAPKIWLSHNLKFESNCKCFSLLFDATTKYEKYTVSEKSYIYAWIWLTVHHFKRKFRCPEKKINYSHNIILLPWSSVCGLDGVVWAKKGKKAVKYLPVCYN